MNILQKFRETVTSVVPVMLIVIILGITVAPLGSSLIIRFIVGGILMIIGLTIFLLGVDVGIQPIGELCGAALTRKRNLPLLLSASFVIGFLVTAAEPDIQVLADQVRSIYPLVNKQILIAMIAGGVGLCMMVGLFRVMVHFSLKIILLASYLLIFAVSFFVTPGFTGIAFDSGGATTGPMTVPFIMALGLGVSAVRAKDAAGKGDSQSDSFGLAGLASAGPILAVLLYGLFLSEHASVSQSVSTGSAASDVAGLGIFLEILPGFIHEAAMSLLPLAALFVVFQILLLKMPPRQVARMTSGLIYSFIGLVIFLTGVNGGFMTAGRKLGELLGTQAVQFGGIWYFLLICTGLLLGAVVVIAEPAVWVLTDQVESVSGGTIKRKVLLIFLSAGAAIAIGLAMWRAVSGFSLMRILIPGYAAALLLMIFCPDLFVGIAFDSGGVASGPISSTFILSFTLGVSSAAGSHSDAFGVISLIAMMPLIAIQILGLAYSRKRKNI